MRPAACASATSAAGLPLPMTRHGRRRLHPLHRRLGWLAHRGCRHRHGGDAGTGHQQDQRDHPARQRLGADASARHPRRQPAAADLSGRLHQQTDDEVQPREPHHHRDHLQHQTGVDLSGQHVLGRHRVGPGRTERAQQQPRDADDDREGRHQRAQAEDDLDTPAAPGHGRKPGRCRPPGGGAGSHGSHLSRRRSSWCRPTAGPEPAGRCRAGSHPGARPAGRRRTRSSPTR